MDKSIFSNQQKILQRLLKEVRTKANLSQLEVANRLAKPQSFVSKYESGERRLDLVELYQVCQAIEVSLSKFIKKFENEIQINNNL